MENTYDKELDNKELIPVTLRIERGAKKVLESLAEREKRPLANYLRIILERHAVQFEQDKQESAQAA